MLNQELYQKDPTSNRLANNGVAEVAEDRSEAALATLRYELETFVCDGQYEKGLERILWTYLDNLGSAEQPGVWISGYFGSGKSHLAKMLRALWVDEPFADGATARNLAHLPDSVKDLLKELSTQGKRLGGLHAAAGKLGAGANDNVRLTLLGIVFKSADLPEQYHQAGFVMWLKDEGFYDKLVVELEDAGETLAGELPHLYVSPVLSKALHAVYPDLASSPQEVRQLIRAQFPVVTDVSNDDMVRAIKDALSVDGKFPLTMIGLDEVQQFINSDSDKAYRIQELTETCCKRFAGQLQFVGTGQMALSGTPLLQKLMGRFPVPIPLSDADVEGVIRKIILAKKTSAIPVLQETLTKNLGEISRHLRGTKLDHRTGDENVMVADYPILPTRRRFWERVLRTVDTTGTVSQLRNQLRIVHEAAQANASAQVGEVVGAEFIYDQISSNLLQTAVMSREVYEHVQQLSIGDSSEQTKSSLLKLIFLINKLPTDAVADTGVRPTTDTLADLLVTNLEEGSGQLRKEIPRLLDELQDKDSLVMAVTTPSGVEDRLQTAESSAWHDEYRRQEAELKNNVQRLEYERLDMFKGQCQAALRQVRLAQGQCKEPRNLHASFDVELPKNCNSQLTVWFQDGWSTNEKNVLADARNQGNTDPTQCDWIGLQERAVSDGVDGAELRLTAAQDLKKRLELILEGEAPYDIFVRWKPLEQQSIGWNPDLNDGVRLNIRPFMTAEVLRHNKKPKLNIHWNKDRGKDVESAPWCRLGLEYGGKEGDRINDHHLSLAAKLSAGISMGDQA
ncbi:MAG: BREX system P-loop protein BrxC [Gammaproteobacteria bacterium]|nr:BREX system P-loop protein BrxC [Gammaproteobacteria bacterium]